MDDADRDSSEMQLVDKVIEAVDHVVPQEEETYTYTEQVVDTTTLYWKKSHL